MRVITQNRSNTLLLILLSTVLFFCYLLFAPKTVSAATLEVNSIADDQDNDGECTLREALIAANTNTTSGAVLNECIAGDAGADTINFNIAGSGVHTIIPSTALPTVTEQVTIDGYSQTGAVENTAASPSPLNNVIKIEIDFSSVTSGVGVEITANNTTINGLSVFSSNNTGILINFNANDGVYTGNYSGFRADGMTRVIDTSGSFINQNSLLAFEDTRSGCQIGGITPADRNVLAPIPLTTTTGSIVVGASDCTIYGNYIGLAKDGITSFGSIPGALTDPGQGTTGIKLTGGTSIMGGTTANKRNVVSGCETIQINLSGGEGSIIQGNYIGTDYTGNYNSTIVNGLGVSVSGSTSKNLVGGTGAGEGNKIIGARGAGIAVVSVYIQPSFYLVTPNNNAFLGNTITKVGLFEFEVFGNSNEGIDILHEEIRNFSPFTAVLTNQGPTPNDAGDADTGANNYINTPVLQSAQQIGNQLTIKYDLDADDAEEPANQYRVEFFANSSSSIFGSGPGGTYLGAATVSPGTNKTTVLTISGDQVNKALSSTTTALDSSITSGFGSTSEFSKNISIGSATDFDSDGASTATEEGAPNNGDGNNDGIQDSIQPTVTSFLDYDGSHYITLVIDGCSENGTVSSLNYLNISNKDNDYLYPHGLIDFMLNCSRGDTVNVSIYTHENGSLDSYIARKYNSSTGTYGDIPGSKLTTEIIGSSSALKLSYSVTDGGLLDDDGQENGIIVDPVGLATEQQDTTISGKLGDTGANTSLINLIAVLLFSVSYLYIRTRSFESAKNSRTNI